jgi:hypothetical protein
VFVGSVEKHEKRRKSEEVMKRLGRAVSYNGW